jgi:hypothetical protein
MARSIPSFGVMSMCTWFGLSGSGASMSSGEVSIRWRMISCFHGSLVPRYPSQSCQPVSEPITSSPVTALQNVYATWRSVTLITTQRRVPMPMFACLLFDPVPALHRTLLP